MPATLTQLTEQTIQNLAGDAVFRRGYRYFEEARVTLVAQTQSAIRFVVQGTSDYIVYMKHTSRQFEATCECPASQGFDFCKHCVAASLFYIAQLDQKALLKESTGTDLLQAYLTSLPREMLVAALADQIQRNPITLQNWMLKAETAAEKLDAKAFKKHITAAIPYNRQLFRYQQVQAYFGKIEALLERLESMVNQLDPDEIIKLVDYAISRINRALDTIDDSGGYRFSCLETLNRLHCDALRHSNRSAQSKAEYLLQKYLDDDADNYPGIPEKYTEALGAEALNLFYQRLQQRWLALPELDPKGDDDRHFDRKLDYLHTQAPLLNKARREGDKLAQIGYLEKTATNVRDMVALAKLYAETDSIEVAHKWITKAKALSEQSGFRAERGSIVDQETELLLLENKAAEAMQKRWHEFESRPDFKNYIPLVDLAKRIDDKTDWYGKAVSTITENTENPANDEDTRLFDTLARIHLHENNAGSALTLAQGHTLPTPLLEEIVLENRANLEQILPLAGQVANHYIDKKNSQGYESATVFLTAISKSIKRKDQKKFDGFLLQLIAVHKAKKSLVVLLDPLLPEIRG